MTRIKTSKGYLEYKNHLLNFGSKVLNPEKMLENLHILSLYLAKIDINWGPAFGTLIGIVRNEEFQPWKPVFDIYILKEDEECFKDILWLLLEADFEVVRYERRGRYYLVRNGEYIKVFVLTKVCSDVRHTGSSDFIHEKYIQNTVKWYFKGIQLNVPAEVDEYLEFQYGKDWTTPKQTVIYSNNLFVRYRYWMKTWIQDHLPDDLYYKWILNHRKKDFKKFKMQCVKAGIPLPLNVQLASMQPRKYRKVMTVGVYDLLHKGHVELYRRAKGLGDYLIVAAQDGDFILKYKPTAQVMNSTEDRKYMIKAIRYVDEVITYTDVDKIVQEVDFDVFVTGPDQIHAGFQRAIQWCEEHGKEHIVLGRTDGISSSELKAKIAAKTKK
ncbi:glycerol-3-phosphate cytidylyltransferase [Bacteroides sp. AF18-33]|uniref:adenylyltransferase/cytidyltransferase family protein n=1 Tax=Bacteroides sp. AF18-33 TaxID=2292920 RepID=UPI000E733DB5|nr:adenylyltransferase/cytidyltransferase family protein [Bacteroides sp. AF18-33]RJV55571.1 glycerol-3-phosphate cytidylyltransferase [Bacteroides sp. AF18-33]